MDLSSNRFVDYTDGEAWDDASLPSLNSSLNYSLAFSQLFSPSLSPPLTFSALPSQVSRGTPSCSPASRGSCPRSARQPVAPT